MIFGTAKLMILDFGILKTIVYILLSVYKYHDSYQSCFVNDKYNKDLTPVIVSFVFYIIMYFDFYRILFFIIMMFLYKDIRNKLTNLVKKHENKNEIIPSH